MPVQVRSGAQVLAQRALALLFPHFSEAPSCSPDTVPQEVEALAELVAQLQRSLERLSGPQDGRVPERFLEALPGLYATLREDADAIYQGDPAARSRDEVILTYPGFYAIAVYRIAHALHGLGVPLLPRLLTEWAHRQTGVDIHPGAHIGRRFFIDHGTGVVIGETAVIGNGVKLYQGVTLGALAVEKALSGVKRHPTLEDHVVVYSNATILGGNTVVGHDSTVGGNAWLTQSVPPFSLVTHQSEVRQRRGRGDEELEYNI